MKVGGRVNSGRYSKKVSSEVSNIMELTAEKISVSENAVPIFINKITEHHKSVVSEHLINWQ